MSQLFSGKDTMLWKHAEGMSLRYGVVVLGDLIYFLLFKDFYLLR